MNIPGPAVARPGMFQCSRAPGKGSLPSRICLYRKPCRLLRPWKPLLDCCARGNLTRSRTTVKRRTVFLERTVFLVRAVPGRWRPPGRPPASPKKSAAASHLQRRGHGGRAVAAPTTTPPSTRHPTPRTYSTEVGALSKQGGCSNGTLNSRSRRPSSSRHVSSTSPASA